MSRLHSTVRRAFDFGQEIWPGQMGIGGFMVVYGIEKSEIY